MCDFIVFLPPNLNLTPYKNYCNNLCKTLSKTNNEKMKKQSQVVVLLRIELDFILMKAFFKVNKLDKVKLLVVRILGYNIIMFDKL